MDLSVFNLLISTTPTASDTEKQAFNVEKNDLHTLRTQKPSYKNENYTPDEAGKTERNKAVFFNFIQADFDNSNLLRNSEIKKEPLRKTDVVKLHIKRTRASEKLQKMSEKEDAFQNRKNIPEPKSNSLAYEPAQENAVRQKEINSSFEQSDTVSATTVEEKAVTSCKPDNSAYGINNSKPVITSEFSIPLQYADETGAHNSVHTQETPSVSQENVQVSPTFLANSSFDHSGFSMDPLSLSIKRNNNPSLPLSSQSEPLAGSFFLPEAVEVTEQKNIEGKNQPLSGIQENFALQQAEHLASQLPAGTNIHLDVTIQSRPLQAKKTKEQKASEIIANNDGTNRTDPSDGRHLQQDPSFSKETRPLSFVNPANKENSPQAFIQPSLNNTALKEQQSFSSLLQDKTEFSSVFKQQNTSSVFQGEGLLYSSSILKEKAVCDNPASLKTKIFNEITEQIKINIKKAARLGTDKIDIVLKTKELGSIKIHLEITKDGDIKVALSVNRDQTFDLLRTDIETLKQSLADSGFNMNESSFSLNYKDGQDENQDQRISASSLESNFEETDLNSADILSKFRSPHRLNIKV